MKNPMKFSMKRSLTILDELAKGITKKFHVRTRSKVAHPDDGLHAPVTSDKDLDRLMELDLGIHNTINAAINGRKDAKTYWDVNLLKKTISRNLDHTFKGLDYDVTDATVRDVDFIYVDVKHEKYREPHRHIFRLSPFGFVDTSHFYDDVKESYLESTVKHSRTRKEARTYYDMMKDKSWKE